MQNAYDLYLKPKTKAEILEMIALAKHMRYEGVSISLETVIKNMFSQKSLKITDNTTKTVQTTLKKMAVILGRIGQNIDMTITARVTTGQHDPFRNLYIFDDPFRNIVVAFRARTEEAVKKALKYEFPYLVSIPINNVNILSSEIRNLSRQFYKPIEITLRKLITVKPQKRGSILKKLRRVLEILNKQHFKIIFSSGATTHLEMRSIRGWRSLLQSCHIQQKKIIQTYKTASNFFFQPKPAVKLHPQHPRNADLLKETSEE